MGLGTDATNVDSTVETFGLGPSLAAHFGGNASRSAEFVEVFQALIDALPEQIALVDDQWTILAVNPAWTQTAALYGYELLRPGANYAEFCAAKAGEGHNAA